MRTRTRTIAPVLPLMYALRLLWAGPRILLTAKSVGRRPAAGFVPPAAARGKQHPTYPPQRRLDSRLLPWAYALPLDGPVIHRRSLHVRRDMQLGTDGFAASGEQAFRATSANPPTEYVEREREKEEKERGGNQVHVDFSLLQYRVRRMSHTRCASITRLYTSQDVQYSLPTEWCLLVVRPTAAYIVFYSAADN